MRGSPRWRPSSWACGATATWPAGRSPRDSWISCAGASRDRSSMSSATTTRTSARSVGCWYTSTASTRTGSAGPRRHRAISPALRGRTPARAGTKMPLAAWRPRSPRGRQLPSRLRARTTSPGPSAPGSQPANPGPRMTSGGPHGGGRTSAAMPGATPRRARGTPSSRAGAMPRGPRPECSPSERVCFDGSAGSATPRQHGSRSPRTAARSGRSPGSRWRSCASTASAIWREQSKQRRPRCGSPSVRPGLAARCRDWRRHWAGGSPGSAGGSSAAGPRRDRARRRGPAPPRQAKLLRRPR
jgi:hypothetical protein